MGNSNVKRTASRAIVGVLVVMAFGLGTIAPAGAEQSIKTDVTVTDDFSSGGIQFVVEGLPADADVHKVAFINGSIGPHVLEVYKVPDDWTRDTLLQSLRENEEPPDNVSFVNAVFAKSGQTHQGKYDLTTTGTYAYFCPIPTPAGTPHFELGFVGVFQVS